MGNRIYYAVQQVGIKPASSGNAAYQAIHGVQSIGAATNFTIIPISTWGSLNVPDSLEETIESHVNMKKVLDGTLPVFLLSSSDSATPYLVDRIMTKSSIAMSLFDENQYMFATGTPLATVQYSGLYVTSLKYNFEAGSNFDEEIAFMGSHNKIWANDVRIITPDLLVPKANLSFNGAFDNKGNPNTFVSRRWDFILHGTGNHTSLLPIEISGQHVNSVSISASINRTPINGFGDKSYVYRMPNFPIEINTEITVTPISGDNISASEDGILTPYGCTDLGNVSGQLIQIATCDGFRAYLGSNNKLTAISQQGGDTAGGNVKYSYSYKGYNNLTMTYNGGLGAGGISGITGYTKDKFWDDIGLWVTGTGPGAPDTVLTWHGLTLDQWTNLTTDQWTTLDI